MIYFNFHQELFTPEINIPCMYEVINANNFWHETYFFANVLFQCLVTIPRVQQSGENGRI